MKRFLQLLKTQGSLSSAMIGKNLGMTTEGARLQLLKLEDDGYVVSFSEIKGIGRPQQKWKLTEEGNSFFPDSHSGLTVQLIETIKSELGNDALSKVIHARELETTQKYLAETRSLSTIEETISKLTEIRKNEGYLAEWKKEDSTYYFIENHCPICSAAKVCLELCQSELNSFGEIFSPDWQVIRTEHIIEGERRCVYRIEQN